MSSVVVRAPVPADARAMGEADYRGELRALEESFPEGYPPEWLGSRSLEWCEEHWAFLIAVPGPASRLWVAEIEGSVVGFVHTGRPDEGGDVGRIHALYVHPDAWRRGAGRALLDEALAFLRGEAYPKADLWVIRDNARARGFYEAAGFAHDGGFQREPVGLPLVHYVLRLN